MVKIKIYSTTTCPYCHQLKEYLKGKGFGFEEVVLNNQPDQAQVAIDTCGSMSVPCTHIIKEDGTEVKILGFDKGQVDLALGIN